MKSTALLRTLGVLVVLLLLGWIVMHTRWVEENVDDDARGAAATDPRYSLRRVVEGAGATLEVRSSMEPMPPADATLFLQSALWNIFPERDARLKAWVESGGHLVLDGKPPGAADLRWVPLSFVEPRPRTVPGAAKPAAAAASDADDDTDDETDVPATRRQPGDGGREQQKRQYARLFPRQPYGYCTDFHEAASPAQPAFEPGRVYRGCGYAGKLHTLNHAEPAWTLANATDLPAIRVAIGRGSVTGVSPTLITDNHGILQNDNALIAAAILQLAPGRAVWIVEDERREPLLGWLWHEARTPTLLALAAIALALWRLMVRFGPREAVPPRARRSMGEQVRGTGQFIAGTDPRALHAATRRAFDDVARTRVEDWAGLDDAARVETLAAYVAHSHAIDRPALLQSMNIGASATPAQILAATAVLEQSRRVLLRTPAAPPPA
jgi:hypothetical protein